MTERLYYTDAYLRSFEAAVTDLAEDGRRAYLDRTAFYPTSGGQPHDTGLLGDARVLDVVDEGPRIAHLLEAPIGLGPITGAVDWPRRLDHMRQHTGQHLISAVLAELYGHVTTSVHFGSESSTLDLDAAAFEPAQVAAAETRANEVVMQDRPVEVGFEEAGEAEGLRKAPGRAGTLRVVTIRELDRSACGGTHVRATGEIGMIQLRRVERVRKSVRLEFLCGPRAVSRARADLELLGRIAAPYSAAAEELPALLEGQRAELKRLLAARRELELALDARRARELHQAAPTGADGIRHVVVRGEPGMTLERLRGLAQAVCALPRAVCVGTTAEPPGVLLASSADAEVDAGKLLRAELERVGGRGGGNARLAQGTVPAPMLPRAVEGLLASLARRS